MPISSICFFASRCIRFGFLLISFTTVSTTGLNFKLKYHFWIYLFAGSPRFLGILRSTHWPPSGLYLRLTIVRPFPWKKSRYYGLGWLLAVRCYCGFRISYFPSASPPRVRTTTFLLCNRHIYRTGFGQHWTLCCLAHSSVPVRPTMWFLFVGSGVCPPRLLTLTSGFLQIPPHDEHPCLRLTLPTAERVVVFHHLVVAHAGRTKMQSEDAGFSASSLSAHERYWVDTPARGCLSRSVLFLCYGGGGIRTHGTRKDSTVFKTASLNRSDTPPKNNINYKCCFNICQLLLHVAFYTRKFQEGFENPVHVVGNIF